MANKKISELAAAGALTGAELIETVQGGVNVQTTTQNIANLAPATPGAEAFLDLTDVPNSYSGEANKVVSVKADESGLEFTTPASGSVTAGSGISVDGSTVSFGSLDDDTVQDGSWRIRPINNDSASLLFGTGVNRFAEVTAKANKIIMGPPIIDGDDYHQYSMVSGYGAGGVFNWFGVVNNQVVSGTNGALDGNVIVTNNGSSLDGAVKILELRRTLTGSSLASNGAGAKIVFTVANDTLGDISPAAGLSYILTDVTNGSEDSKYVLSALVNGVETTIAEFTGAGIAMGTNKITGLGAATANGDAVRYEQHLLKSDSLITAKTKTSSHTLDSDDLADLNLGKDLLFIFDSATAVNFTIPQNADLAVPIGGNIYIKRINTGVVTLVQGGSTTITASSGVLTDGGQNLLMCLHKTATNAWYLENGSGAGVYADYVPTFGGFSTPPSSVVARYTVINKMCHVYVNPGVAGTSNATTHTVTLPFNAKYGNALNWSYAQDNGATLTTPGRIDLTAGSNTATLQKTSGTAAWTASGAKRAIFSFSYEIE